MDSCPNCGADLNPQARVCPECGSDEKTGWSESAQTARLDLPGENFDYDEFVGREFGNKAPRRPGATLWWVVGIALTAGLILMLFRF